MQILKASLLVFSCLVSTALAEDYTFEDAGTDEREIVVNLKHDVTCEKAEFPGLRGTIALEGRTLRFELYAGAKETKISLGLVKGALKAPVVVEKSDACKLTKFAMESVTTADEIEKLVLEYSPYVNLREDQYKDKPLSDLPIAMVYHLPPVEKEGLLSIVYTIFFPDEDSLKTKAATSVHMGRYGRRADIEWSYRLTLDVKAKKILKEEYHGMFHFPRAFTGKRIGNHPILYNSADNNVFGQEPAGDNQKKLVGHHFAPIGKGAKIEKPLAREAYLFANPWMFVVSDAELAREGKISYRYDEYLFALIDGKRKSGALKMKADFGKGVVVGEGTLDRLGEDMWGSQSYSALPIGKEALKGLGDTVRGDLSFEGKADFVIDSLKFYRPKNGGFEEVKADCNLKGADTNCRF